VRASELLGLEVNDCDSESLVDAVLRGDTDRGILERLDGDWLVEERGHVGREFLLVVVGGDYECAHD